MVQETTALGAAYLAGLAEGVWSSTAEVAANWQLDATFEPGSQEDLAPATPWARAVERARHWADDEP